MHADELSFASCESIISNWSQFGVPKYLYDNPEPANKIRGALVNFSFFVISFFIKPLVILILPLFI